MIIMIITTITASNESDTFQQLLGVCVAQVLSHTVVDHI